MLNSKKRDAEERQARIDKIQSKCRREVDRVEALRGVSEGKVRVLNVAVCIINYPLPNLLLSSQHLHCLFDLNLPQKWKEKLGVAMEALQQKVKSLEEAKINNGNELATNDREKRRLEQEASELRRKIKEFDDQLSEVMTSEDGDLEDELDQTKLRLEKARLDLQVKEANKFTYAAYIKDIDGMVDSGNKSSCPTCNRAFKSEAEAREAIP